MATSRTETETAQLNITLPLPQQELFDRAAESMGMTRTQFILDAAQERAEEHLVEQNMMELDAESFDALQAMLDAPPVMPDGLRRLLARRPIWETEG